MIVPEGRPAPSRAGIPGGRMRRAAAGVAG